MIKTEKLKADGAAACKEFYGRVITETPDMDKYGRWKEGLYPTCRDIESYINNGEMYVLSENGVIIGAMAVSMKEGESYRFVDWALPLSENEAAVIHVLAVNPNYQGQGFGGKLIDEAISIARKNGKKAIRLDALACNTPAHRLYLKKGFVYRGVQKLYAANTGETDFFFFELKL